ncbi:MAG: hypothetical protein ABSA93_26590 [Streptosporangiaceae bacterium]|jgi:hypothetical protein
MNQFHLDAETIAEYQAGALAFWHVIRRRRIATHLAQCPDCSSLTRRLTQVSLVLAAAPLPAMPADVAERLTAALAAESSPSSITAAPSRSRRLLGASGGRGPRLVPAMTAMVVLVALGIGGYALSQTSSPSPLGGGNAAPEKPSAANGRLAPDHVGTERTGAGVEQPAYRVVATGTDYLPQTLRAQVIREMKAGLASVAAPPAALAACMARIGAGSVVTFVDLAQYQGRTAWIVASADRAWVTGTLCSASRPDLLTSISLVPSS